MDGATKVDKAMATKSQSPLTHSHTSAGLDTRGHCIDPPAWVEFDKLQVRTAHGHSEKFSNFPCHLAVLFRTAESDSF